MSASVIKFEVQLPSFDVGTDGDVAEQTFMTNMETLGPIYTYEAATFISGVRTQQTAVYGLITAGQASTALGYLNTLNTALGNNVQAISYTVTSQP
jgi:hypothetical protein